MRRRASTRAEVKRPCERFEVGPVIARSGKLLDRIRKSHRGEGPNDEMDAFILL